MQFDENLEGYGEIRQHEFTWPRVPREPGGQPIYSRVDRIYSNGHPIGLQIMTVAAGFMGFLTQSRSPSDKREVWAVFRRRGR